MIQHLFLVFIFFYVCSAANSASITYIGHPGTINFVTNVNSTVMTNCNPAAVASTDGSSCETIMGFRSHFSGWQDIYCTPGVMTSGNGSQNSWTPLIQFTNFDFVGNFPATNVALQGAELVLTKRAYASSGQTDSSTDTYNADYDTTRFRTNNHVYDHIVRLRNPSGQVSENLAVIAPHRIVYFLLLIF